MRERFGLGAMRASAPPLWVWGAACLFGVAGGLGQAPWSLWLLALLGFAGLFWLFERFPSGWIGWIGGCGYFATALFWIIEPFLVDVARHGWMAPFALFFLASGLAVLWAVAFSAARWFGGRLSLVVLWCAMEMLRAVLFTGFPWATVGHIWIDTPVALLAALGGAPILTFLALSLAALLSRKRQAVIAVLVLAAAWGGGHWHLRGNPVEFSDTVVRFVQPNAEQHLKWDSDLIPVFFQSQLAMTRAPAERRPDVVIWPETAIAYRIGEAPRAMEMMSEAAAGVPIIFGGNRVENGTFRNALAVMGADGTLRDTYDKHHLVPFGEYVPFGDLLGRLGIRGLAARDGGGFAPGPGQVLLDVPGLGQVLPLICYELIFPRHLRTVPRADVLVQITNDAWFGNVSGPYQHLSQAQLRAIEQGLPVLRVANTGVSAAIDPLGRLTAQTQLGEAGYLDADVPQAASPTPYSLWGDAPMRTILLVLVVWLLTFRTDFRRSKPV